MSARATENQVARILDRAATRIQLLHGVQRAGGALLVAVLLVEAAAFMSFANPDLARLLLVGGAAALLVCVGLLARTPRPDAPHAAHVLDTRLGSGAAVASAAEALAGQHPRFGPLVLAEAKRALEDVTLGQLLPLRAPAGLLLGAALAVLLPVVFQRPAAAADVATGPQPISLLAPEMIAAGGGGASSDDEPEDPAEPAQAWVPVVGDPGGVDAPGDDPLAAFSPHQAAALREHLQDLADRLPQPASPASEGAASGTGDDAPSALSAALSAGDVQRALAELGRLEQAAAAGDRAAALHLKELAADAGAAGAGSAGDPAQPGDGTTGGAAAPSDAAPTGSGGRLPWRLQATRQAYFGGPDR